MNDVNAGLFCGAEPIDPEKIMPLVGFSALPFAFQFKINMYRFGQARCYVMVSARCLCEVMDVAGVGQCRYLIHEAIYDQLHMKQIDLRFCDGEDLPALLEVFAKHKAIWEHFDQ